MPYSEVMQTVVETPEFLAAARKAGMTDGERERAVDWLAAHPDAGDIMPGTGGCRKLRIARDGGGKSGGYRVITWFTTPAMPVFLLTVIAKGKQAGSDASAAQPAAERKVTMDKDDFASLQRALDQAAGFMAGDRIGHLVHEPVDVKAIRARTHMSSGAICPDLSPAAGHREGLGTGTSAT